MAINGNSQRGPLTVAGALEAYPFRFHKEDDVTLAKSGLILICAEKEPPREGRLLFRIFEAVSVHNDAGKRATELLRHWRTHDAKLTLFALIGPGPHLSTALMSKLQDAVAGQRTFSIPSRAETSATG